MLNRRNFKADVEIILENIGVSKEDVIRFTEHNCTLRDIKVCIRITDVIDSKLKDIYEGYDGCTSKDTFDSMYEWNNEAIKSYEKGRTSK